MNKLIWHEIDDIEVFQEKGEDSTEFNIKGIAATYGDQYNYQGLFTKEFKEGSFSYDDDTVLLANHDGMPFARVGSGTLKFNDTSKALEFSATLDRRDTRASDMYIQLSRRDLNGVSVGVLVQEDTWEHNIDTKTDRQIITKAQLMEISLTGTPKLKQTSVDLSMQRRNEFFSRHKDTLVKKTKVLSPEKRYYLNKNL